MARLNINVLAISELKWTEMDKINSNDHYIYYHEEESLIRNGVALTVNKRVQNAVLGCNLKKQHNNLCSSPRQSIQYHSNLSLSPNHYWRSWSWHILWRPIRPSRTSKKKNVLFIIGDWYAQLGSQQIYRITGKLGPGMQNETGQQITILSREHAGHSKHPFPTAEETMLPMDITKWSKQKSDWLCSLIMSILKEISPEYSLEGWMLKLKRQYFGHLLPRTDSLEKTLMLGKIKGGRRRGWQRMRWLDGITDVIDMSLSRLRDLVMDREASGDAVHGVTKSWAQLSDWTELNELMLIAAKGGEALYSQ